jgi:hypothetical protein
MSHNYLKIYFAKLVALWVRIQTSQKYEMGDISTGVANTLYNDKKENQIFSYIRIQGNSEWSSCKVIRAS